MNRKIASKQNGKKGGRPIYSLSLQTNLSFNLIILTPGQYGTLLDRYGKSLLKRALSIFQYWLLTSAEAEKYIGKNNYAHFREDGWVINMARSKK